MNDLALEIKQLQIDLLSSVDPRTLAVNTNGHKGVLLMKKILLVHQQIPHKDTFVETHKKFTDQLGCDSSRLMNPCLPEEDFEKLFLSDVETLCFCEGLFPDNNRLC